MSADSGFSQLQKVNIITTSPISHIYEKKALSQKICTKLMSLEGHQENPIAFN
jgi:hypothetical protein